MYLKKCWMENTGPISKFDVEMPFHVDGRPKPVILVGGNGAGKTVVLSYIADALVEIAKKAYQDVVPGQGFSSPYLRIVSIGNQKVGTSYSFAFLSLEAYQEGVPQVLVYREQTGTTAPQEWDALCEQHLGRAFPWSNGIKEVEGAGEALVEKAFEGASNCFFPSSRFERPHWHNPTVAQDVNSFDIGGNFSKQLGMRPIIVSEAAAQNQSWLLHVLLDARADIEVLWNQKEENFRILVHGQPLELDQHKASYRNACSVLQQVLQDPSVIIGIQNRALGLSRLCVLKNTAIVVPSLDHLSAGQSILLNTFLTIIRYADRFDTVKGATLEEITGIVLIDEIDAHMHADLQYGVLPKLIKLFPKVQFIITSHAPLFVLGMEREFGPDNYVLLEMPDGNAISAERFSEFQRSFDYYQQTKTFEDEQRERLSVELEKQTKPLIFTEGDTDRDYLRAALHLLGYDDLLSKVNIEWVGVTREGQATAGGDGALNRAFTFLHANPELLNQRRVMLLYDCDTGKPNITEENIWVRTVPHNQSAGASIGIESLLPPSYFNSEDRRFYNRKENVSAYGERKINESLDKRSLCNYICDERRDPIDFAGFDSLIVIVEQFVNNSMSSSSVANL